MKDIGKARRKDKTNEKPNSLRFDLEIPNSFGRGDNVPSVEELKPNDFDAEDVILASSYDSSSYHWHTPDDEHSSGDTTMQVLSTRRTDTTQPPPSADTQLDLYIAALAASGIERLWTGRMDPFIQYPIRMNHSTLNLMDHGE
jgi:hypothetical protein